WQPFAVAKGAVDRSPRGPRARGLSLVAGPSPAIPSAVFAAVKVYPCLCGEPSHDNGEQREDRYQYV
ncbi:hypothetical protein, partial [Prevotella sp. S7-1-8]|uniref:hypothetical protein n=1 Tax=Prevotella sp. S7-1-8 TaxID=1284775 RepID=UPI000568CC88